MTESLNAPKSTNLKILTELSAENHSGRKNDYWLITISETKQTKHLFNVKS